MKSINTILKEEINRFILNENINSLSQYAKSINYELNKIGNVDGLNPQLQKFVKDFEIYCIQIIHAINRCISAKSLNEGLGGWGINVPPELGGNFWNDAVRGYYQTKNFLTRGNYGYNNKGNLLKGINPNTVPSVKLSVLLQQFPSWQNNCIKYRINKYIPENAINNILGYIKKLEKDYYQLLQQQNAQGQQP